MPFDSNYFAHMKRLLDPAKIVRNAGIKKDMVVADLGCGPGFFTVPIAKAVGGSGRVYAVDSDPSALAYLSGSIDKAGAGGNITVIEADVSRTGIAGNSVDALFLANVFHDIADRTAFFMEARRISKPKAMLIDVDWDKVATERGPPLEMRIGVGEAKKIFSDNGFKVEDEIDAGQNHYGLLCRLVSK